ncbi:hypothetical protein RJZ56_005221 [Blastomyces dermatitidis]|uniref:PH domain-containing protein n=2 Tax=Ajellomyces dermatitidis TaxID=5039 RepID=F2TP57_AJEDA|nr:PH domain-containing protein [Blastomyces dermatitidis ER-3]EEQ85839.1 PH domain-containing protein [Blastomyces dermatitidis ER-3]EGE85020.1 PH domain-containing protein [Blastomyces dermatitidis ATCC 18188]EQL34021.1 hypothetical protein BDFG_03948 [Blastomyces dermatitidis ATCC 26199]
MAARPRTPLHDEYTTAPNSTEPSHANQVNGSASRLTSYMATPSSIVPSDFQVRGVPVQNSTQTPQVSRFHEDMSSRRGSSVIDGAPPTTNNLHRSDSQMSAAQSLLPSRASGTLKKKPSLSKKGSLRRGGSRRSSRAGSVRSMALGEKEKYGMVDGDEVNSAFYVPIPTSGSPTDVLAARFQAWRKVLKDLIMVFREIQKSYEIRSKTLLSVSNSMNNVVFPATFLATGGISDATKILKEYHRQAVVESAKARDVELEVIKQLTGLRSDLQQKIKEIKSLSGDFRNSVDKELEGTRKAVRNLQEALGLVDTDPAATSGKGDPFLVKCAVHRQLEKQIDEENYLHRAFLNLENSGRELERIVVTEIQKTYNIYANILKRDADAAYDAAGQLIEGPISVPQDHEWDSFVSHNDHLVDPLLPIRDFQHINYPGKNHPAAAEVRAGMLERKSKYLKSYTPGWYVLSPTHLHEYKSADRIEYQNPVMSLYLPEQKLGSHSQSGSASHKFMLKGRQTGSMHRGHSWVFRAESHDTMLEWYNDIKNLAEKTGEDRNAFVRKHSRQLSGGLYRAGSISSSEGVMDEDEADETPYSADHVIVNQAPPVVETQWQQRPQPGGRFPSDIHLHRNSQATYASSRESSGNPDSLAPADTKNHPTGLPDGVHDDAVEPSHSGVVELQDHSYVDWMDPAPATAAISSPQKHTYPLLLRTSSKPDTSIGSPERTISPANAFGDGKTEAISSSHGLADKGTSLGTSLGGTTVSSATSNIPYSSGALEKDATTPLTTPAATEAGSPKTMKSNFDRSRELPSIVSDFKLPGQYPTPSG